MKKTVQIASAFLLEHPVRVVLTTLATAAASCLVVCIAGSYESLHQTYDDYAHLALGRYPLAIAPISMNPKDTISERVLSDLQDDPSVQTADSMGVQRIRVEELKPKKKRSRKPEDLFEEEENPDGSELLFVSTDAPNSPHPMKTGSWIGDTTTSEGVVLRADVAEKYKKSVGGTLRVRIQQSVHSLKIVGIVESPNLPGGGPYAIPVLTPSSGEAFITNELAMEIFEKPEQIHLIGLALKPDSDLTKFRFRWGPRLSSYKTPVQFQESIAIEEALDQAAAASNVRMQSYASTGIAFLVSALVILCSLSIGVTERTRQYAILRTVGFRKSQVGCVILLEAFFLGLLGWVFGLIFGWLVLQILQWTSPDILNHGIQFGFSCFFLPLAAMFGGSLLAAIIPIWRVTKVRPLDAMPHRPEQNPIGKHLKPLTVGGLILVLLNPLLSFVVPTDSAAIAGVFAAIGFTTMTIGFVLLGPIVVWSVDAGLSRVLSRILRIDPKLLVSQISSRLWRTVGSAVSLSLGLGLFVGVHVWGWTMLQAFVPGNWTPDAIAVVHPGFQPQQLSKMKAVKGIDPKTCVPLVVEQPRLKKDLTNSAENPSVVRQDNLVMIGLDPEKAIGGPNPLLQFDWVAGNPKTAVNQLKSKRSCLVPDHFLVESGLELGDFIDLVPPKSPEAPVRYEIVGVVKLPGWHWQTKITGLRPRTHRTAALVFAAYDNVSEDFQLSSSSHLWFRYQNPETADLDQITTDLNRTVAAFIPEVPQRQAQQELDLVRVVSADQLRDHINHTARRWLWLLSQVPIVALMIAFIGVANVMLASVRSRRWEFGVLISIGIRRGHLTRAILAEGILITLVACVLSVSFGILAGWCGSGLAQHVSFFGGLHPPLVIPVIPILYGCLVALLLGTLTSLAPALVIGRSKPLELLNQSVDAL